MFQSLLTSWMFIPHLSHCDCHQIRISLGQPFTSRDSKHILWWSPTSFPVQSGWKLSFSLQDSILFYFALTNGIVCTCLTIAKVYLAYQLESRSILTDGKMTFSLLAWHHFHVEETLSRSTESHAEPLFFYPDSKQLLEKILLQCSPSKCEIEIEKEKILFTTTSPLLSLQLWTRSLEPP